MTGLQKVQTFLGIKTVIAESFERIHRSNLSDDGCFTTSILKQVKMLKHLGLTGKEAISVNID